VDGVVAQNQDVAGRELPATRPLEAPGSSAEEGIVLLPAVHPDHGPHPVLMGVEGHAGCPCHVQHREVGGVVQRGDAPAVHRTQYVFEVTALGDQFREDVAHRQRGRALGQGRLAPVDDVFDCERRISSG
jgi:hypothetical protein